MAKFEKGHKKVGGRKAGSANIPCLSDAVEVYEEKGGKEWLRKWIDESPYNKREFVRIILAIALKQVAEKREHSGEVSGVLTFMFGENGNGKDENA